MKLVSSNCKLKPDKPTPKEVVVFYCFCQNQNPFNPLNLCSFLSAWKTNFRSLLRFFFFVLKDLCNFASESQYIAIMTLQEIGKTIRDRRKQLGINQQTLADLSVVAINTIVSIERGEGNPQTGTLLAILNALGLQMDINLKQLDYETM